MLTGCGFGVIRVDDREELAERFKDSDTALLLFDFQTKIIPRSSSISALSVTLSQIPSS